MAAEDLAEIYYSDLGYRSLNTYKLAISAFQNCGELLASGEHLLITNLMGGHRLLPSTR